MKKACALILAVFIFMTISVSCYAYKTDNSLILYVDTDSITEQTAGIDILVKIDKQSDEYVSLNTYSDLLGIKGLINITDESQISYYDINGYISYLCHFNNVSIDCHWDSDDRIIVKVNNFDYFIEQGSFIIAFIDNQGNVLSVTDKVSVKNGVFKKAESISINRNQAVVNYYYNPYYIIPVAVFIIAIITVVILRIKVLKKEDRGRFSVLKKK